MANLPQSDHYRNGRFYTPGVTAQSTLQFFKWITHRKMGYWPRFVATMPGPPPPERVEGADLNVTFVNHSTFLIQTGGLNLLTDPVWSDRVSPFRSLGPRRHRDPGIRFEDLPPIDCILISHNHYDHVDLPTLRRLAQRWRPAVFCPLGVRPLLLKAGMMSIVELDWWGTREWKGAEVHCVPARHFSSRTPFDRDRTLWCGWVLEIAGSTLYFAGDTGFGGHFDEIASRFPQPRLALLPIGAYEPQWFMGPVHMTPEQAVDAHRILGAETAIAAHFGTFALADDSMAAPVDRLQEALRVAGPALTFVVLPEGEAYTVAQGRRFRDPSAAGREEKELGRA